jgi:phospholipase/carboxylesterase
LLLLIHGWTGDEDSMWVFVRNFGPNYWVVAPRAPYAGHPHGYSWRPLEPGRRGWPDLDDLRPAAHSLIALVEDYSAANGITAPFAAIGFSQGAALTGVLALLHPDKIDRAGILAGFVPSGAESLVANRPLAGKSLFVAHGTLDEMVSVQIARRSVELLKQAGADVTYCEDEVGHKLSAGCQRALETFFA